MITVWKAKGKYLRVMLVLLAAFLMFAGPTYLLLVLQRFGVPYPFLLLVALVSFVAGAILFVASVREE